MQSGKSNDLHAMGNVRFTETVDEGTILTFLRHVLTDGIMIQKLLVTQKIRLKSSHKYPLCAFKSKYLTNHDIF
jgi:hypothetical protein